jgi:hypothetical protein
VHVTRPEQPFRHPAAGAALAARNAVAAEMAVAGRAGHHPGDDVWWLAADTLAAEERAGRGAPPVPAAVCALAMPLDGARAAPIAALPARKPAARRRRELLELVAWFLAGGAGAIALLAVVRLLEQWVR